MKISGNDFTLINALFNSPMLDPKNSEKYSAGLLVLDAAIKKFHKKLTKKFQATESYDEQGRLLTDFGPKHKDYRAALDKGLKLSLPVQDILLVQSVRDYLIFEKFLNKEGKITPPYDPSALIMINHLVDSLTIKKSYDEPTTGTGATPEVSTGDSK